MESRMGRKLTDGERRLLELQVREKEAASTQPGETIAVSVGSEVRDDGTVPVEIIVKTMSLFGPGRK